MAKNLLCCFLVFFWSFTMVFSQKRPVGKTYFISGNVTRAGSDEALAGANVQVELMGIGTKASKLGYFLLKLPAGQYIVRVSSAGMETKNFAIEVKGDMSLNVELTEKNTVLEEVDVKTQAPEKNIKNAQMGVSLLNIKVAKKLPTLLGEVDVIRNVLLLPGVTTVGEGATGFNVRGGSIDQNLVLMENAPIFNSSHLLGLFSVFNPDAVSDLALFKGGIPAQYGGRAASVLDIKLKDPSRDRIYVQGGIGLVASRLSIDGPIIKDKIGFLVAARGSFSDYLFSLIPNESIKQIEANFYDLTAKMDYQLSKNDRIVLTAYRGRDVFKLPSDSLAGIEINAGSSRFEWVSQNATLRWSHVFSKQFSLNLIGVASNYIANIIGVVPANAFSLDSDLLFQNLKIDAGYYPEKHKIDFGYSGVAYTLKPGSLLPTSTISNVNQRILPTEKSLEYSLYVNDDFEISKKISLLYGVRYTLFLNKGATTVYQYKNGVSRDSTYITGSKTYGEGETVQSYSGFEPRVSLRLSTSENSSLKFSYNRMRQYIQLVSNTTAALPTARWKISDEYLHPQTADQISMGYFKNFVNNAVEASVEVYYKNIQDVTDYKDGANLLIERYPEAYLLQGTGRAYGIEWQLKKNSGKFTGWLSYTFSRAEQLINGDFAEEKINGGKYYPTNYDKPHQVNLVMLYQKNKRVSYSANFTFSSGRAITYPDGKYYIGGIYIPNFTNRNQDRIPDYHRLDIAMTIDPDPDKKARFRGSWTFSIYNLYARQNAYSVFFKSNNNNTAQFYNSADTYKLSVFGTIFPAITYNFKF
jgi:ferric enterobactin receptor